MEVWRDLAEVPPLAGSVVTIGMFAGMHRGHRAVIGRTVELARERGVPAVAITFHPHPATVHRPERRLTQLATLPMRLADLEAAGIDAVLLVRYTLDFAAQSAEEFIRRYVVEGLKVTALVLGEDARFGRGNTGDEATARELGERFGFDTVILTDLTDPESGRRWSSTWVREALELGDVETARRVMDRPHIVRGEVVHGAKRGRELGFPTANLDPQEIGLVPADGVYAGWLTDEDGERYPAAISVGTNPTFEGVARTVEAHVLGRDDLDLYGHVVTVQFTDWIRPMISFDGIDPLLARMGADVQEAARLLGVPEPAALPRRA